MVFLRYILPKLLLLCFPVFLFGCKDEGTLESGNFETDKNQTILSLQVRALSSETPGIENDESIKSLRIIIIDENGEIECNKKVSQENLLQSGPGNDLYYFFHITTPGKKKFYLFANEEKVNNINGQNQSLTSFLSNYVSENGNATEFEDLINNISFFPEYEKESDGKIYLPYSSYYQLDMKGGTVYEKPMYLVPVAAKICFNFFNNREFAVKVKEMGISSIADKNYLLGQPSDKELTKTYNGESLYWVDWLAKVSAASNEYPEFVPNVGFNEQNGWIINYSLPEGTSHSEKKFIWLEQPESNINVKGSEMVIGGSPTPGQESLDFCYLPESCFFQETKSQEQVYYLNLNLEDANPHVGSVEPVSIPLNNIKALFRNTKIIVNINFNEGTDDIYVEIRSWFSTDYFFGTVTKSRE